MFVKSASFEWASEYELGGWLLPVRSQAVMPNAPPAPLGATSSAYSLMPAQCLTAVDYRWLRAITFDNGCRSFHIFSTPWNKVMWLGCCSTRCLTRRHCVHVSPAASGQNVWTPGCPRCCPWRPRELEGTDKGLLEPRHSLDLYSAFSTLYSDTRTQPQVSIYYCPHPHTSKGGIQSTDALAVCELHIERDRVLCFIFVFGALWQQN